VVTQPAYHREPAVLHVEPAQHGDRRRRQVRCRVPGDAARLIVAFQPRIEHVGCKAAEQAGRAGAGRDQRAQLCRCHPERALAPLGQAGGRAAAVDAPRRRQASLAPDPAGAALITKEGAEPARQVRCPGPVHGERDSAGPGYQERAGPAPERTQVCRAGVAGHPDARPGKSRPQRPAHLVLVPGRRRIITGDASSCTGQGACAREPAADLGELGEQGRPRPRRAQPPAHALTHSRAAATALPDLGPEIGLADVEGNNKAAQLAVLTRRARPAANPGSPGAAPAPRPVAGRAGS
jgi:hypothetical protein